MGILRGLFLLAVCHTAGASFTIELPVPPGVDDPGAFPLGGWASFNCPSGNNFYPGIPGGPVGDPPSLTLTFHDNIWSTCLQGPWWSYPYITDGEVSLCDTTYHIGSIFQITLVWEGNYVLDVGWPACGATGMEKRARPAAATLDAHPNPFNPSVRLVSKLDEPGHVRLSVHDLAGREVARLADGNRPAGVHADVFHAHGMATGVYLVRLETAREQATRRILLLR